MNTSLLVELLPFAFLALVTGLSVIEVLGRLERQRGIVLWDQKGILLVMLFACAEILSGIGLASEYVLNDSGPLALALGVGFVSLGILILIWPMYDQLSEKESHAAERRVIALLAAVPVYVGLSMIMGRFLGESATVVVQLTVIALMTAWAVRRLLELKPRE